MEENVVDLDEDIDFLFDEQVIQDERLLGLEQGINVIDEEVESGYKICSLFVNCLSARFKW